MKRRRYRRRTRCGTKIRHAELADAVEHRAQLYAKGAARLDIYPCGHCGFLHVGHHHKTR
jgi:rubrerythrin